MITTDSGPVTAGVIRAEKFRFQLFGDTMNVASRMESTGSAGRIHLSQDSAALLKSAGKGSWLVKREDVVSVKGTMTTFWVKISPDEARLINPKIDQSSQDVDLDTSCQVEDFDESPVKNRARLIEWNTEVLLDLLRKVVVRRRAIQRRHGNKGGHQLSRDTSGMEYRKYVAQRSLVDHVAEVIPFSNYEKDLDMEDPSKVYLSPQVKAQARAYVEECAALYNDVAFHNFEHASHVVMSANKLLGQIITPEEGGFAPVARNAQGGIKISREFHERTYGISCDPLMHFAAVQAAMIHDVAHLGKYRFVLKSRKKFCMRCSSIFILFDHRCHQQSAFQN
jgi:Adenylate and Guanylate cyclase catalytic domain